MLIGRNKLKSDCMLRFFKKMASILHRPAWRELLNLTSVHHKLWFLSVEKGDRFLPIDFRGILTIKIYSAILNVTVKIL